MDMMKRFMHHEKYGKLHRAPNAYELNGADQHRVGTFDNVPTGLPKTQPLETRHMKLRRAPDAYQLYEQEHRVRTFDTVLVVSPKPSGTEAGTFTTHYSNTAKPHRPRDAYEIYEQEHSVHTFEQPRGHESISYDNWCQKGSNVQYYQHPNDGNIDSEAEKFLAMKHKKFELSRWMSTDVYEY